MKKKCTTSGHQLSLLISMLLILAILVAYGQVRNFDFIKISFRVGSLRFELKTSAMSRRRHNQLDHEPRTMSDNKTLP